MNNKNSPTEEKVDKPDWTGFSILIVEDDFYNFKLLEGWAGMMKANVIRAEGGQEAVDICLKNNDVNIVLMDIQLPGMNGYDATRLIKEARQDLPVIAVTANPFEDEKEHAEEAGCDGFITKPIDIKQLKTTLYKFLPRA